MENIITLGYCKYQHLVELTVVTQEGGYSKGGTFLRINPVWQVTASSIPLAKLGRAVTTST